MSRATVLWKKCRHHVSPSGLNLAEQESKYVYNSLKLLFDQRPVGSVSVLEVL